MADTALSRLRRLEGGDTHSHGPGCDHSQVRRSAAPPSGAPVVGYEGGALDSGTSDRDRVPPRQRARPRRRRTPSDGDRVQHQLLVGAHPRRLPLRQAQQRRVRDRRSRPARTSSSAAGSTPPARRAATGSSPTSWPTPCSPRAAPGDRSRSAPASRRRRRPRSSAASRPRRSCTAGRGLLQKKTGPRSPPEPAKPRAPKTFEPAAPRRPGRVQGQGWQPAVDGRRAHQGRHRRRRRRRREGAAGTFAGAAATPMLGGLTGGAAGRAHRGRRADGPQQRRQHDRPRPPSSATPAWEPRGPQGQEPGRAAFGGAASRRQGRRRDGLPGQRRLGKIRHERHGSGAGNATLGAAAGGLGVAAGSVQALQGLWRGGKAVQKLAG